MRNAWQDNPDPDATRALPVFHRFGPESIRYADGASQSSGTSGPYSEFDQHALYTQYTEFDQHDQDARPTTDPAGPRPGWFSRHRPDLWVLGGGSLVTAAAFAAAFAAASGAMATSQQGTAQPAAAHATATPAARPACVSPDAGR